MNHTHPLLLLGLALVAGCYQGDPFATDDDDAATDDDDAAADDDDDAATDDDDAATDDDDDATPPGEPLTDPGALVGLVYSLDLGSATYIEPPGAGAILELALNDEFLLFTLTPDSSFADGDQPGLQVVGAAGKTDDAGAVIQDLCNESLNLTAGPDAVYGTADDTPAAWSNPQLSLGPTDLQIEVSGDLTTLQDVRIEGIYEPDLQAFTQGTFSASMDTRSLDDSLGGGEGAACTFVADAYGVECHECGPPLAGPFCLTIEAEDMTGALMPGTVLQPRSCVEIIWNYVTTGACQSAAEAWDADAGGALDGEYQGCPEFDF